MEITPISEAVLERIVMLTESDIKKYDLNFLRLVLSSQETVWSALKIQIEQDKQREIKQLNGNICGRELILAVEDKYVELSSYLQTFLLKGDYILFPQANSNGKYRIAETELLKKILKGYDQIYG